MKNRPEDLVIMEEGKELEKWGRCFAVCKHMEPMLGGKPSDFLE